MGLTLDISKIDLDYQDKREIFNELYIGIISLFGQG